MKGLYYRCISILESSKVGYSFKLRGVEPLLEMLHSLGTWLKARPQSELSVIADSANDAMKKNAKRVKAK